MTTQDWIRTAGQVAGKVDDLVVAHRRSKNPGGGNSAVGLCQNQLGVSEEITNRYLVRLETRVGQLSR